MPPSSWWAPSLEPSSSLLNQSQREALSAASPILRAAVFSSFLGTLTAVSPVHADYALPSRSRRYRNSHVCSPFLRTPGRGIGVLDSSPRGPAYDVAPVIQQAQPGRTTFACCLAITASGLGAGWMDCKGSRLCSHLCSRCKMSVSSAQCDPRLHVWVAAVFLGQIQGVTNHFKHVVGSVTSFS